MQQAIPYRTPPPSTDAAVSASVESPVGDANKKTTTSTVTKLVAENPVTVIAPRGCCMCFVVKQLLLGHGVNPTIFDVDEKDEIAVIEELAKVAGPGDGRPTFPAVFVGGKLFGGLEKVMAAHLAGELVPILKAAGALWL